MRASSTGQILDFTLVSPARFDLRSHELAMLGLAVGVTKAAVVIQYQVNAVKRPFRAGSKDVVSCISCDNERTWTRVSGSLESDNGVS